MYCKICCDISKVVPKTIILHNSCRSYQTHYDVLNLSRSCTSKEIRSAFIKLSKEHHPDVNKSKQSHARFQKINEAYKILGKPESRRCYDLGLSTTKIYTNGPSYYREAYYQQPFRHPYDDPQFWINRNRGKNGYYRSRPYYGVEGIPRLSNGTIAFFCILISLIGTALQFYAISNSVVFKREALIRKSLEAEKIHNETVNAANINGNQAQIEALKVRLLEKTDDK